MTGTAGDILVARSVSKTFLDPGRGESVVALADVSLAVRAHEFVSVIGPSGCGKSTFLRIVAGLDKPSSGEILVSGRRVEGPGADRGMVFQEYALLPWKTTQANIEFGPRLKGLSRAERAAVARRFIDLVGLTGFETKYPHQLSGGMRQRAAVARVLANNPTVLLMDEPFAAVDAMTRQRLQEELAAIAATERTTVLFITHAIDEAVFLSDRVVALSGRPGRIVADVAIDLPRPRQWSELAKDTRFATYRDRLHASIHGAAGPRTAHA
ncbi:MAG: ABC transporter ATP-binding protein [Alphaproteobacteria bacterium]|nr:ABC transporter ATP-binding protein [Alphaproteobacteria bacterium]